MAGYTSVEILMATWGAITLVLIGLAIYRSILGFSEYDHIFSRGEGLLLQREQRVALERIAHVEPWIRALGWISAGLLLLGLELWLYEGLYRPLF